MQIIGLSGIANGSIDTLEDGIQMIGYNNNPSYKGVGTGTINIMNSGLQIVGYSGGSACVGSIKTMNNGQQQVNDGGTGTVTDLLGGIQIVRSGGTATATTVGSGGMQYIEAGAVISGTVLDGGSLRLRQTDSAYTLANTLTINNGVLDLTNGAGIMPNLRVAPVYQMLTLNDLQGTGGNIYMDTDLANNTGDQIIVNSTNNGTGTYAVYVNDQSIVSDTELTGRLLLIDDQSGRLNFEGITANNGGLWDATPVLNKETNQWYLSRIVKTANNDTKYCCLTPRTATPCGATPRTACAAAWVSCMEVLSMTTGFGLVRRPDASVAAVTKAAITCTNWVMIKYLPIKVFTVQLLITVMAQVAMPTAAVRTN